MTEILFARKADLDAITGAAWIPYTPVVSSIAGTITTASATGRYVAVGKTITVQITTQVTANGTGSSGVVATLPFAPAGFEYYIFGRDTNNTGKALIGRIRASTQNVSMVFYDNSYPGADGVVLTVSGTYEAA
jgi:hypothetical protein